MNAIRTHAALLLASSLVLSACGEKSETTDTSTAASTVSSDWATDACKVFPAADATMSSGIAIASATTSDAGNANQTNISQCTYATADGKPAFTIMLRHDLSGTLTSDMQMKGLTAAPDMTGPTEEVVMAKGKAIWTGQLKTLSYVPDDARMIIVSLANQSASEPNAEQGLKQQAIGIANAIER